MEKEKLLSTREAAASLGISTEKLTADARAGKIPSTREQRGRRQWRFFRQTDLIAYREAL